MVKIALKDGPDNGLLLALWDGAPNGGTYNCINYAANQGLPIINAWANALSYQNDE
jgi:hypothetical protein